MTEIERIRLSLMADPTSRYRKLLSAQAQIGALMLDTTPVEMIRLSRLKHALEALTEEEVSKEREKRYQIGIETGIICPTCFGSPEVEVNDQTYQQAIPSSCSCTRFWLRRKRRRTDGDRREYRK